MSSQQSAYMSSIINERVSELRTELAVCGRTTTNAYNNKFGGGRDRRPPQQHCNLPEQVSLFGRRKLTKKKKPIKRTNSLLPNRCVPTSVARPCCAVWRLRGASPWLCQSSSNRSDVRTSCWRKERCLTEGVFVFQGMETPLATHCYS